MSTSIIKTFSLLDIVKIRYSFFIIVAIVLSMTVAIQTDFIQTADAVKAKGVKTSQYGQDTKNKVCGDRLCTPEDFTKEGVKKELTPTGKPSISSNVAMSKMERLFELHRIQLLSAWDSLNDSEKSHMMKMLDKMYEKMQSMTFEDHMKHMSSMMDGKHDMKDKHDMKERHGDGCSCGEGEHGCSCGEGEHGCSCGEGEHGCSCGEGEHSTACESSEEGCTCSEDGVCTCGQGCTCASCH
jgi:hypothetical protein